MQLKIRRSQREGGIVSKNVIFCLDARMEFAPEEKQAITRYKLQNEVIYNSEASKRLLDKGTAQQDGSFAGNLKSLASVALAAMKLNITIAGLERGQHIECKSLDELLGAEEAIMTACRNLKGYLETAMTFDGREVLIDFPASGPAVLAQAVAPQPLLAAAVAAPSVPATPALPATPREDTAIELEPGTQAFDPGMVMAWFKEAWQVPAKRNVMLAVGAVLLILLIRSCSA